MNRLTISIITFFSIILGLGLLRRFLGDDYEVYFKGLFWAIVGGGVGWIGKEIQNRKNTPPQ